MTYFKILSKENIMRDDCLSSWEYLSRTNNEEFIKKRKIIEKMLKAYPEKHKHKLLTRLKNANDEISDSAYYELYLYTKFLKKKLSILIDEPIKGGEPDFTIDYQGEMILIEATSTLSTDNEGIKIEKLKNELRIYINSQIPVGKYFLHMEIVNLKEGQIKKSKIKAWLVEFIQNENVEIDNYCDNIIAIRFRKMKRKKKNKVNRIIQMTGPEDIPYSFKTSENLIKKKISKYNRCGLPLILAFNYTGVLHDFNGEDVSEIMRKLCTEKKNKSLSAIAYSHDIKMLSLKEDNYGTVIYANEYAKKKIEFLNELFY